jgi:peroxiredoxin
MTNSTQISLREQIATFQQQRAGNTPADQIERQRAERADLLQATSSSSSLQVGDIAPDFTLPDAYGKPVTLSTLLKAGPVVVTFYRGDWCPFCNLTLRAYQAILPEITALHGSLVAISPQNPEHTLLTVEHKDLTFPVLSDVGNQVARQYTRIWTVPEAERSPNLQPFYDDDKWQLPAPGTFVIASDGKVKLAFVDADYTQRLEPDAILNTLRELA